MSVDLEAFDERTAQQHDSLARLKIDDRVFGGSGRCRGLRSRGERRDRDSRGLCYASRHRRRGENRGERRSPLPACAGCKPP